MDPAHHEHRRWAVTNLAGYRICFDTSTDSITQTIDITNVGISSCAMQSLTSGTWYFTVKALTTAGAESCLSNVASKTIPDARRRPVNRFTVRPVTRP